jgi:hypothetical protein
MQHKTPFVHKQNHTNYTIQAVQPVIHVGTLLLYRHKLTTYSQVLLPIFCGVMSRFLTLHITPLQLLGLMQRMSKRNCLVYFAA